jgi:hypothetical protein
VALLSRPRSPGIVDFSRVLIVGLGPDRVGT